jgi:hypothetical protein
MKSTPGPILSVSQRVKLTALLWAWPILVVVGLFIGQAFQRPQLVGIILFAWLISLAVFIPVMMSSDHASAKM